MNTNNKAELAAARILELFQTPEKLPAALANVYLCPLPPNAPSNKWSFANRVLMFLADTIDARGFKQWKDAGRPVKKGAKAFTILAPCTKKITDRDTGEERTVVIGFRGIPVFRMEDTEGPLPESPDVRDYLDSLPLMEVAREWGITVEAIPGGEETAGGYFVPKEQHIALANANISVWIHELMHAADHRAGNLKEKGQHWRSETVAEFGSAVLLTMLGMDHAADLGGAYKYIKHYATDAGLTPAAAAMKCLDRIDKAIQLILATANKSSAAA